MPRSPRAWPRLALISLLASGCAAAKGTYVLVSSYQDVETARAAEAEEAEYYWTMAEEYMAKAYEEWGHSDYGPAEELAKKATEYAGKARDAAASGVRRKALDEAGEIVPEEFEREQQKVIQGKEEVIDEDFDEKEDGE